MSVLAQAGFLVYAFALPGYGRSAAGHGSSDGWLRALLDELAIAAPVIVSPSMSGRYALPLVTEQPDRIAFEVNLAAAELRRLRLSAPLLQHARRVLVDGTAATEP